MEIIDSHLHLFDLAQGDYHWLKEHNPPFWPDKADIAQSFCEADLRLSDNLTLAGFVHIETGFDNHKPWREVDWLESHCTLPFRSVGGVDLCAASFESDVLALAERNSVAGVRHILDDQAQTILTRPGMSDNFKLLAERGLSFDAQFALADTAAVNALLSLCESADGLRIIINHTGFIPEGGNEFERWQHNLAKITAYPHAAIKLSGWEMVKRQWHADTVTRALNAVQAVVPTERIMLGSNFPLCLWRGSYQAQWATYLALTLPQHQQALLRENTRHWYQFN
ncbi:amidohydrolase family protein [Alteromonas pelagimontana]|uniref:Amidohydrolase family protein n=1 Tax=Alteromonas pelagimontana TaxID=1858656 RepID=A0A6M4MAY3_9ALTE|nr:amidohydrolase family protein [Alteromonas pelagimontana]QJR80323.1 amidohydrolase family protein [Alteromonas pelagimontana]